MSQIDELLNGLSEEEIAIYTTNLEIEPHIVIGEDRVIVVPEELRRIAVQHDHNVETVMFDCPRYWDEHDLSSMKIYVNYMRSDGKVGKYLAKNVTVDTDDDTIIHFEWTISRNVSLVNGSIILLVCAKLTDLNGKELTHWNSELNKEMYVSEGMETDNSIVESDPDIITQLLVRMDEAEEMVGSADILMAYKYYTETKEAVEEAKEAVEEAKAEHEELQVGIETERARVDQLVGGATVAVGDHIQYVTFNHSGSSVQLGIDGGGLPTGLNKIEILSIDADYQEDSEHRIVFIKDSVETQSATLNEIKNDPTILGVWSFEYLIISYESDSPAEKPITIAFKIDSVHEELESFIRSGLFDSLTTAYELRPSSDMELYDIRIDADGKTHPSAGEAVRSMARFVKNSISEMTERINNSNIGDLATLEARVKTLEDLMVDIENALKEI